MVKILHKLLIFLIIILLSPVVCAGADEVPTNKAGNAQTLRALHARAAAGNAEAQLNLGGVFYKGQDVTQDFAEAAKWFTLAARKGLAQAQYNLGVMYATGQGVNKDSAKALHWCGLAAKQGLALAQLNLGVAHATGFGVPQNESEAVKWFRLAAVQGEIQAQFNLGVMYANGQGVSQNPVEAYHWAKLAAAQGHETAKSLIEDLTKIMTPEEIASANQLVEDSRNNTKDEAVQAAGKPDDSTASVKKDKLQVALDARDSGDFKTALKYLMPLANKGNAVAQLHLGEMNEMGQGVPQNDGKAVTRYLQAAKKGNAEAQYRLAGKYELGQGVSKNRQTAAHWYKKSAAQGFEAAVAKLKADEEARKVPPSSAKDEPSLNAGEKAQNDASQATPVQVVAEVGAKAGDDGITARDAILNARAREQSEAKSAQPKIENPPAIPGQSAQPSQPATLPTAVQNDADNAAQAVPEAPAAPATGKVADADWVIAVSEERLVERAVRDWAAAWSGKDANSYLAAYLPDFQPEGGSHEAWKKQRMERIGGKKAIKVELSDIRVSLQDESHATALFTQVYRSENYRDQVAKTLLMVKQSGLWLIAEERTAHAGKTEAKSAEVKPRITTHRITKSRVASTKITTPQTDKPEIIKPERLKTKAKPVQPQEPLMYLRRL